MYADDPQFLANDELDRQRLYLVLAGLAGQALGVDPGAAPYDQTRLSSLPNGQQNQYFSIAAAPAVAGQPAAVAATVGGETFTIPVLVLVGVAAWLILRK